MSTHILPHEASMSETGKRIFALGLTLAGQVRRRTDWQQRLIDIHEQIARLLAEHAALESGLTLDYAAMPEGAKARFRTIAGRAIEDLDPQAKLEAMLAVKAETLGWAAGLTYQPHPEDVIGEALARYEAARLAPAAPVLGAPPDAEPLYKCRICGGIVCRHQDGRAICDNCGREFDR